MTDPRRMLGDPLALAAARAEAHAAVQPLSRAERANLLKAPDDGDSNLGWSREHMMFVTHPLGAAGHMAGLRLAPLTMIFLRGGRISDELPLAGVGLAEAEAWLDARLEGVGLSPACAVKIPYALPDDVAAITTFGRDHEGLAHLAAWYALAAASLEAFAAALPGGLDPGPSPVRCWPHHFDIATYVGLAAGDPETAPGIGVGFSPGDQSYDQPYFYVNPWPHLAAQSLPDAVRPGHWHTEGFVGMIATGEEILSLDDIRAGTEAFLRASFDSGRSASGA